jgi:hypothetical protein
VLTDIYSLFYTHTHTHTHQGGGDMKLITEDNTDRNLAEATATAQQSKASKAGTAKLSKASKASATAVAEDTGGGAKLAENTAQHAYFEAYEAHSDAAMPAVKAVVKAAAATQKRHAKWEAGGVGAAEERGTETEREPSAQRRCTRGQQVLSLLDLLVQKYKG